MAEQAQDIFGTALKVRLKTSWWWTLGMTQTLAHLRGLEQIMVDMLEAPDFVHRLMAYLRDGTRRRRQPLGTGGEPHRYRSRQSVRAALVARGALVTLCEATAVTQPTLRTPHGNGLLLP